MKKYRDENKDLSQSLLELSERHSDQVAVIINDDDQKNLVVEAESGLISLETQRLLFKFLPSNSEKPNLSIHLKLTGLVLEYYMDSNVHNLRMSLNKLTDEQKDGLYCGLPPKKTFFASLALEGVSVISAYFGLIAPSILEGLAGLALQYLLLRGRAEKRDLPNAIKQLTEQLSKAEKSEGEKLFYFFNAAKEIDFFGSKPLQLADCAPSL